MLNDIITSFCLANGYNRTTQYNAITSYINRAAKDIYDQLEADSLMREVVLIVPRDQQVSMPPYIGELRGMREYNWQGLISLNEIGAPRYSSDTFKFKWRNWTYKGKRALAQSIINAGPMTLSAVGIETVPAQIIITGRTTNSHKVSETIVMSATSVNTVNSYLEIDLSGIACLTTPRTYDITISDINGNVMAVLNNNESVTDYVIVDVSAYPWQGLTGDGNSGYIEVLYKTKFYKLFNLTDEFSAPGYDDAIAYRALFLWCQGKDGKENDALGYLRLCQQCMNAVINNDEKGQQMRITQGNNSTYNIFRRLRNTWGRRYDRGYWW